MGKDLWTDDEEGEKIEIINVNNNEEEAIYISDKIEELISSGVSLKVLLFWSGLVIKLELLKTDLLK